MITNKQLLSIFERTSGHCHFCGDPLVFEKYGLKDINDIDGAWEADHVIQKQKGGNKDAENCLPSCVKCNRLRWHRKGDDLRELIFLGLITKDEIKKNSLIGKEVTDLRQKRISANHRRRRITR